MLSDIFVLFLLAFVALSQWLDGRAPLVMLCFIGFLLLGMYLRERNKRLRTAFLNHLRASSKELQAGGSLLVDGKVLRYDTELTTFYASVGSLFSVVIVPSRYHFPDEGRSAGALSLSLLSLISGWWSPTGPIHTLSFLHQNLSGGERKRVQELIAPPE